MPKGSIKQAPMTKTEFKKWLRENKDKTFTTGHCKKCPIAIFLHEKLDVQIEAWPTKVLAYTDETDASSIVYYKMPSWATNFITVVDLIGTKSSQAKDYYWDCHGEITGKDALKNLT